MVSRWPHGHPGDHLGYWNGMILAILNHYVAPMLPIKVQRNLTYCFVRCCLKNFKVAAMAATLEMGIKQF